MGCREFWCRPKAAPFMVKSLGKLTVCPFHQLSVGFLPSACLFLIDGYSYLISRFQQLLPVVLPEVSYPIKQIHQAKSSIAAILGKIGSGKEWLLIRSHKDRQGPSTGAGHGLTHGHIHSVDVRALLPVHFDADELPVKETRNLLILKGFMSHHMAPVAGRVPDTEEYRLILPCRLLECFFTPGIPVHGIFPMLHEIRRFFLFQSVWHSIPPMLFRKSRISFALWLPSEYHCRDILGSANLKLPHPAESPACAHG